MIRNLAELCLKENVSITLRPENFKIEVTAQARRYDSATQSFFTITESVWVDRPLPRNRYGKNFMWKLNKIIEFIKNREKYL